MIRISIITYELSVDQALDPHCLTVEVFSQESTDRPETGSIMVLELDVKKSLFQAMEDTVLDLFPHQVAFVLVTQVHLLAWVLA